MRRPVLAGLVLGLAAIGSAGAFQIASAWRERPPLALPHLQRLAPSVALTAPRPGRTAITPDLLREAYVARLIDRPIKSLLNVPSHMTYGQYVWNDRDVPPGPVWIRVDLTSQILSVFRSGDEIGTTVILYGTDGLPTPTGKFPILAKLKD